jgi:hypothetical protein
MEIYCVSCGKGTEYSESKPKFCGFCAKPFAGTVLANIINNESKKYVAKIELEEDGIKITNDEENSHFDPNSFKKVEIEDISFNLRGDREKFQDIRPSTAKVQPITKIKGKKISKIELENLSKKVVSEANSSKFRSEVI